MSFLSDIGWHEPNAMPPGSFHISWPFQKDVLILAHRAFIEQVPLASIRFTARSEA
jgi:hypothetical protein